MLGNDAGSGGDGPVPMEIDRIDGRPKGKSGNKGKSKDSRGRAKESRKGSRKANKTSKEKGKVVTKRGEKAVLVEKDQREKESQTSSATHAVAMGILLVTAGKINSKSVL